MDALSGIAGAISMDRTRISFAFNLGSSSQANREGEAKQTGLMWANTPVHFKPSDLSMSSGTILWLAVL